MAYRSGKGLLLPGLVAARAALLRSTSSTARQAASTPEGMQGKVANRQNEMAKKDVPLGMLKADGSSKRFFKGAGVNMIEQDDPRTGTRKTMWALTLDGRSVRTPANKLLALPSERMAMAVAVEFDAQDLHILPYTMPLTTLAVSSLDQVSRFDVRKIAINNMVKALNNDLLTLRSTDPDDLVELENKVWGAICEWAEKKYGTEVRITTNFVDCEQSEELMVAVEMDLLSRSDWRLTAIEQVAGLTGSTLLSLALSHDQLDSDSAVNAARLVERYQVARWGKVESSGMGGHDIDEADMRARMAACAVYHRLLPSDHV